MSRTRPHGRPVPKRTFLRGPLIVGVTVLAVLIAAGAILLARQASSSPPVSQEDYAGLDLDGRAIGPQAAPVMVVEYSDFQCPFCKRAETDLVAPLKAQYLRSGKVRFEYHPVAILGPESIRAAESSLCAQDQGKFWLYHDKLFAEQAGENRGAFSDANLKRFAAQIGLDAQSFNSCLDSGQHRDDVQQLNQEAQAKGVTGTPTFFVNEHKFEGLIPFSQLKQAIDAAE